MIVFDLTEDGMLQIEADDAAGGFALAEIKNQVSDAGFDVRYHSVGKDAILYFPLRKCGEAKEKSCP